MAIVTINRGQTWERMLAPLSGTRRGTYTFIRLGEQGRRIVGDSSIRGYMGRFDDCSIGGCCEINHADFNLAAGAEVRGPVEGRYRFFNFDPHMETSVGVGDTVFTGARHVDEGLRSYNLSREGYRDFAGRARQVAPIRPRDVTRGLGEVAALLE